MLSWHLDCDWSYDPDPARASEVEVTFAPAGEGTRVELVHRGFERHRSGGGDLRESVGGPGGWGGLLTLYSDALGSS